MWFRNLQIYRFSSWLVNAERLEAMLAAQAFVPCTALENERSGWISPCGNDRLVHAVGKQVLIALCTEKKLLPPAVIRQVVRERAAEIEAEQGFKPGRKQMRELKEQVTDELMPRAFALRSETRAWLDLEHGWFVIDTARSSRADEVFKLLLRSVDSLPFHSLRTERSPVSAMTAWLEADMAPAGFTVDQDVELTSKGESGAKVRYVKHSPETEELRRHIVVGKQCTRLALTWADKVSFDLSDSLAIRKVKPLTVLQENVQQVADEQERFDVDFALMSGELHQMLTALVNALGGEYAERKAA